MSQASFDSGLGVGGIEPQHSLRSIFPFDGLFSEAPRKFDLLIDGERSFALDEIGSVEGYSLILTTHTVSHVVQAGALWGDWQQTRRNARNCQDNNAKLLKLLDSWLAAPRDEEQDRSLEETIEELDRGRDSGSKLFSAS